MKKTALRNLSRRGAIIIGGFGGGTIVGALGNIVGQRSPYGNMLRARVKPVNPNTSRQQTIRLAFQQLSYAWSNVLTSTERSGWVSYASNTPILTKKGTVQAISGRAMFIRSQMVPFLAGETLSTPPPATPGEAGQADAAMTVVGSTGVTSLVTVLTTSSNWILQLMFSRFWSPSKNYYSGPYDYTAYADESSTLPLALPVISPTGATGDKVFVQQRFFDKDTLKVTSYFRYALIAS